MKQAVVVPKPPKYKIIQMFVTPAIAKEWLRTGYEWYAKDKTEKNRIISPGRIAQYVNDIRNGDWLSWDTMIIRGEDGSLADGQHRLEAIVASGVTLWMNVQVREGHVRPRDVRPDQGLARAASFTSLSSSNVAVARCLYKIALGDMGIPVSADTVARVAERIEGQYARLSTAARHGYPASVAAAFCYAMWARPDDEDAMAEQYRGLVEMRNAPLWPGVHAASTQARAALERGTRLPAIETFLRYTRGLHESRDVGRIQMKDLNGYWLKHRPALRRYVG